jgi:hypothetical protein
MFRFTDSSELNIREIFSSSSLFLTWSVASTMTRGTCLSSILQIRLNHKFLGIERSTTALNRVRKTYFVRQDQIFFIPHSVYCAHIEKQAISSISVFSEIRLSEEGELLGEMGFLLLSKRMRFLKVFIC